VTDIATDDLCTSFEALYGSSVSCQVSDECGEVVTFALYDNSGGGDTDTDTDTDVSNTPSPVIAFEDAIVVSNDDSTQAYYLSFVMDHIDDCYNDIDVVQLHKNGLYVDNDQYYYDNGHKFAFNYVDTTFQDLLPITLRILFTNGESVELEDIITDLGGDSVFTSTKACDGEATPVTTVESVVQTVSSEDGESTSSTNTPTGVVTTVGTQGPESGALCCGPYWVYMALLMVVLL